MSTQHKYLNFHNNTKFPIHISSWTDDSNVLQKKRINPYEKLIIYSIVGEWHIDSMFDWISKDAEIWRENGLTKHYIIGKFRSDPCAQGNYSWLEYDEPFTCVYSEPHYQGNDFDTNKIKGLITFGLTRNNMKDITHYTLP